MAVIKVRGVSTQGISEDVPASELPLEMFSYGENLTFTDGRIENTPELEETLAGVHGEVLWLSTRYNQTTKEPEIIYVSREDGVDNIYIIKQENLGNTDGTQKGINASRVGGYTAIEINRFSKWQGFSANGVVVLTNGINEPQVLMPTSDQFIDLPNWKPELRCKAMMPFKGVWVAMNISDSTAPVGQENKTNMVMWSEALADVGTYPNSWEPTDLTGSGFSFLTETGGGVVTGAALRDYFLIYKTDSIVRMDYTGDVFNPFIFRTLDYENGIWSSNSVVQLSDRHFVVCSSDIVMTNGIETQSVSGGKVQNELARLIYNNPNTRDVVLSPDFKRGHIYVLAKTTILGEPVTQSYVYNYKTGIWSRRKVIDGVVDYTTFLPMLEGTATEASSWEDEAGSWDELAVNFENTWDATRIASVTNNPAVIYNNKVYVYMDYRNRETGDEFLLKKHDIDFDGVQGVDSTFIKSLTNLYPVSTKGRGYLILKIWGHSTAGQEVDESSKKNYVIDLASDHKFDVRVSGRYISYELSMDKDIVSNWESYNFQNYITKPTSQPLVYFDLSGVEYDLSLTQRR